MTTLRNAMAMVMIPALLLTVCSTVCAQSGKVAGWVNGTQEVLMSTTLADGRLAKRLAFSVTVVTDDQASPIHLASQDCFATYIFTPDGKPVGGRGSCDGISADGHLWWLGLEMRADGIVNWTNLGGVGKFAKLKGNGTTTIKAQFPDGKMIGRFEGTYSY